MIEMESALLRDVMPQNLLADEGVRDAAAAIDTELKKVSELFAGCLLIARIDELPSEIIDILARQWHVDFYDDTFPVETKRNLVKSSIAWHRHKGTPWAVEDVVSKAFGRPAKVTEWFDYGGEPYHFKVTVRMTAFSSPEAFGVAYQGVMESKNVRSVLDSITSVTEPDFGDHETDADGHEIAVTRWYKAFSGRIQRRISLKPEIKYEPPKLDAPLYCAGVVTLHRHTSPGIFRVFGRSRVAIAGHIHRRIYSVFNLGGEAG